MRVDKVVHLVIPVVPQEALHLLQVVCVAHMRKKQGRSWCNDVTSLVGEYLFPDDMPGGVRLSGEGVVLHAAYLPLHDGSLSVVKQKSARVAICVHSVLPSL